MLADRRRISPLTLFNLAVHLESTRRNCPHSQTDPQLRMGR
jgi:hypothetical protein